MIPSSSIFIIFIACIIKTDRFEIQGNDDNHRHRWRVITARFGPGKMFNIDNVNDHCHTTTLPWWLLNIIVHNSIILVLVWDTTWIIRGSLRLVGANNDLQQYWVVVGLLVCILNANQLYLSVWLECSLQWNSPERSILQIIRIDLSK